MATAVSQAVCTCSLSFRELTRQSRPLTSSRPCSPCHSRSPRAVPHPFQRAHCQTWCDVTPGAIQIQYGRCQIHAALVAGGSVEARHATHGTQAKTQAHGSFPPHTIRQHKPDGSMAPARTRLRVAKPRGEEGRRGRSIKRGDSQAARACGPGSNHGL